MIDGTFSVATPTGPIVGHADPAGGPDLLLLHGGPGLADYMGDLDGETSGWRRIRYQQRGLTPSATEGPLTVARHVADAIAVLDGLAVAKTVLLGHSWGVHLALQVAIAAPDRVGAVVAVDGLGPAGDGMMAEFARNQAARLTPEALARLATVTDRGAALRLLWPTYFAEPDAAPRMPELLARTVAGDETLESMAAGMADNRFVDKLASLSMPVVVMVGEASPIPVQAGEQIAAAIPNARLVRVPNAGHLPWTERPGCVADVLTDLLTRLHPA